MLHTIGASNSRSDCYTVFGTTLSGRSHSDANDSRCLHVNSGRPRNVRASVNKDGKTAALGQQQCKSQAKSYGKSDCPGQGCPKYFVLVSWIQIYIIYSYLLCLHFSFINRFKNSLIHTIVISFTNSSFLYFRPSVRPSVRINNPFPLFFLLSNRIIILSIVCLYIQPYNHPNHYHILVIPPIIPSSPLLNSFHQTIQSSSPLMNSCHTTVQPTRPLKFGSEAEFFGHEFIPRWFTYLWNSSAKNIPHLKRFDWMYSPSM
jgi:hypothetical protein